MSLPVLCIFIFIYYSAIFIWPSYYESHLFPQHSLSWVITWARSSFRTWWTVTVSVAWVMPSSLTPLFRCALNCKARPRPFVRRTPAWPATYAWAMRTSCPAPSHGSCEDLHSMRRQFDPFTGNEDCFFMPKTTRHSGCSFITVPFTAVYLLYPKCSVHMHSCFLRSLLFVSILKCNLKEQLTSSVYLPLP